MNTLRFRIECHGPLHVATGSSGRGSDLTIDADDILPASSVKGTMRAAARGLLGLPTPLIDVVFGARGTPSPWAWSTPHFSEPPIVRARTRIAIGADGRTIPQALQRFEEAWAGAGEFTIDQSGLIAEDEVTDHITVLLASAASVKAVGGDRNRGFGVVQIRPETVGSDSPDTLAQRVVALRAEGGSHG